jgi:hypothetical protein
MPVPGQSIYEWNETDLSEPGAYPAELQIVWPYGRAETSHVTIAVLAGIAAAL